MRVREMEGATRESLHGGGTGGGASGLTSMISKCEKVLPKLAAGTSQHTLLVRRIEALRIAESLIRDAGSASNGNRE